MALREQVMHDLPYLGVTADLAAKQQPRRGGSHLRGGQQGGGMGSAHQRGETGDRAGYCGAIK